MPRQGRSGRGSAPSRPTVSAPSRPPTVQQTRPATTAAYPPRPASGAAPPAAPQAQASAPQTQSSSSPGLIGQVASTAAGVAIGSSLGHAITGFFGGGSSAPDAAQDNAVAAQTQEKNQFGEPNCGFQVKSFTNCMDENQGNMSICNWYLEQLKACQNTASQY
ncbi:aea6a809-8a2f-42a5-bcea-b406f17dbe23 [Sclerotinia trifoliorum]|uniref:Aea6a809-8a2f-42a5-bcea-b406f17dbe23 n=1 Tax=Sclerotinia trifoliorum TaxID=28548 RepID=A0A8H2W1B8_9HELO|nr:aea6a809-8a2f-42a5-bcea-b406f17dbe23 [Sclerotinia trifoliorum]